MSFMDKIYKLLINGKLSEEELRKQVEFYNIDKPDKNKKKLQSVRVTLNTRLRDEGYPNRLKYYFKLAENKKDEGNFKETDNLIGDI